MPFLPFFAPRLLFPLIWNQAVEGYPGQILVTYNSTMR
jgi:hypothetical protein